MAHYLKAPKKDVPDIRFSERRASPLRRQFNEGFLGADGRFSITKFLAINTQIVLLYHIGRDFDVLIQHWESFSAVLVILVAPDTFKKLIAMKYGATGKN